MQLVMTAGLHALTAWILAWADTEYVCYSNGVFLKKLVNLQLREAFGTCSKATNDWSVS